MGPEDFVIWTVFCWAVGLVRTLSELPGSGMGFRITMMIAMLMQVIDKDAKR